jgi:ABC-2 type transport system permease protein
VGPGTALIRAGFRRYAAYPLATLAGGVTNTVFGLLRASVTTGVIASAGGALAGYTLATAVSYAWITQALIAPINVFIWNDLALRVRSGDVAVDLARPIGLQLQYLLADLGRAAYQVLPRGIPPMLAGALTFGLVMPAAILPYAFGLVSLLLAVLISFCCRFLMNLTAFWLLDVRGVLTLYVVTSNMLSGMLIPVWWFPDWLRSVAHATPFPSMLQAPADLITGRITGWAGALPVIAVQAAWVAALLLVNEVVLAAGTRKLVVQGG